MFQSDFDNIIREHFDLSDRYTRHYIATLEDAGQDQLLDTLSSALYDNIVSKVDDIDFGTIPTSRGDITKVEGFAKTEECLNIIRRLVTEYKQSTGVVDVVLSAIQNIKDRKAVFIKAYTLNVEMPMLMYNTMVLAIERSTSLMIATCVEYVKDPVSNSPKAALNKVGYQRTMDDVLFKQLITFNNMCANGSFDKLVDSAIKHPVKEDVEFVIPASTDVENVEDNEENPVEDCPVTPANDSIDPFADPTAEDAPFIDEPAEDEPDDLTGDTEVPAPDEFPEDIDPDTEIVPQDAPADDTVEYDNIPAVNPTEDFADDRAIVETEKEIQEGVGTVFKTVAVIGGIGAALLGGAKLGKLAVNTFIGLLRNLVYGFYYTKYKFSDYLAVQADLLEANANELQYSSNSNLSDDEKEKVVKKQMKTVDKLRKWSNKFGIDSRQTTNEVEAQNKRDQKKKTVGKTNDGDDAILF